jgi:hypothetical protein
MALVITARIVEEPAEEVAPTGHEGDVVVQRRTEAEPGRHGKNVPIGLERRHKDQKDRREGPSENGRDRDDLQEAA